MPELNDNQKKAMEIIELNGLDINPCRDNFFIIGGWDDLEKLVQYYNGLGVRKGYGDLRVSAEGIALGDNDVYGQGNWLSHVITPPYEKQPGLLDIDDILGEWGFGDEYACCNHCGNSVCTSPDSYSWVADYWINEGEMVCGHCVRDFFQEEYIDYLINSHKDANTILKESDMENHGFKKCNCGEDECHFETGFHPGQNDNPKEILKRAVEKNPDREYVFDIISVGQFDTHYTLWSREKKIEGSYPIEE